MATIWDHPSPSDFDDWEALLLAGGEPSTAAKSLGYTSSAFRRADRERHAEALQVSKDARYGIADERGELWALDPEASDAVKLAWLKRWNRDWNPTSKTEISGAEGSALRFEIAPPDPERVAVAAAILAKARGAHDDTRPDDPSVEAVSA